MNDRKKIFIALGSIILIFALFIGSYVIRQNQQREILTVSPIESSEDINETDTLPIAEYGTMVGDEVTDNEVIDGIVDKGEQTVEDGDGSGAFGDPAPKLENVYEDAMANSDLFPFEKEIIRMMVDQEDKSFEEALQSVRPGAKIVEEQVTENPAPSNNTNKDKPTTPAKPDPAPKKETPSGNTSDSADYNNPDTRTDAQKEADANDPFSDGVDGNGGDISHEPEF